MISKENISKCLDFGLLNYWIWNHNDIYILLNQGTGTAGVSPPLPPLQCQYLFCSMFKFAPCLSFPTCTSFSRLWAFLFLFLIMGVSMRLWLGQTGKQERRKETMLFEKCFRWRKYTRSPKYILHSDLDTPSSSNGGMLRGLCQYWFNKVLMHHPFIQQTVIGYSFCHPKQQMPWWMRRCFCPWGTHSEARADLWIQAYPWGVRTAPPRAEGRGHLWWEWSWLDNTSWSIILALKNSAFGDWLAKNSSSEAFAARRILGIRSKKARERKRPSSRCKRGPGEALWELQPEKVSNSKDGLNFLLYIGVQPINNVVIVSSEQGRDSATHIHVSILPQTPLPSRLAHDIE